MWWWLALAIASEVAATLSLRASESFTRLVPSVFVTIGYAIAFYALSKALTNGMTVATAYAVWSGMGMFVIAALGTLLFKEQLSLTQVAGLALIVVGIIALQLGATTAQA
ncbi:MULTISPECIES: DMT family transporter [unclassified Nocardioides]|nr:MULTISPECIES: multidrug efflux SMR transporter [unclassified Nocardioides]KQY57240.1 multidrug transporter [Nocardioides sp. Root140]KQZ68755.1 multidrug transporter [Nocardioides sp. Root151]KRF11884.1 multidrug transporter [Nocardioides sp. Soil796]